MKVEYKGHKILRGLDGVDMRHLRPAAIITGKHEEKQLIDKVIAKSGYVGCVFDDDDGVHGIVTLDGKEDYRNDSDTLYCRVVPVRETAARPEWGGVPGKMHWSLKILDVRSYKIE